MGMLQEGKWIDQWYDTKESKGRFVRKDASFRNWVTRDGMPGPSGEGGFVAEPDRYHLYISHACPWAHRTMIFRSLKGLGDMISLSVVNWMMGKDGWTFSPGDGVISDSINHAEFLHQVYTAADAEFSGRVTVPVLWDKKTDTTFFLYNSEFCAFFIIYYYMNENISFTLQKCDYRCDCR